MNLPFHRIFISLALLLVLLLGAALVVAAQPTYTSINSAQTGPTLNPILQTATVLSGGRSGPAPTLLPIFQTATALNSEDEITSSSVAIDEIENYDGDYAAVVAELQEKGVIPLGVISFTKPTMPFLMVRVVSIHH